MKSLSILMLTLVVFLASILNMVEAQEPVMSGVNSTQLSEVEFVAESFGFNVSFSKLTNELCILDTEVDSLMAVLETSFDDHDLDCLEVFQAESHHDYGYSTGRHDLLIYIELTEFYRLTDWLNSQPWPGTSEVYNRPVFPENEGWPYGYFCVAQITDNLYMSGKSNWISHYVGYGSNYPVRLMEVTTQVTGESPEIEIGTWVWLFPLGDMKVMVVHFKYEMQSGYEIISSASVAVTNWNNVNNTFLCDRSHLEVGETFPLMDALWNIADFLK